MESTAMHITHHAAFHSSPMTCAKSSIIRAVIAKLRSLRKRRHYPHVRTLDDHAMRDIGLNEADKERLRYRFPSQHTHHPRS